MKKKVLTMLSALVLVAMVGVGISTLEPKKWEENSSATDYYSSVNGYVIKGNHGDRVIEGTTNHIIRHAHIKITLTNFSWSPKDDWCRVHGEKDNHEICSFKVTVKEDVNNYEDRWNWDFDEKIWKSYLKNSYTTYVNYGETKTFTVTPNTEEGPWPHYTVQGVFVKAESDHGYIPGGNNNSILYSSVEAKLRVDMQRCWTASQKTAVQNSTGGFLAAMRDLILSEPTCP